MKRTYSKVKVWLVFALKRKLENKSEYLKKLNDDLILTLKLPNIISFLLLHLEKLIISIGQVKQLRQVQAGHTGHELVQAKCPYVLHIGCQANMVAIKNGFICLLYSWWHNFLPEHVGQRMKLWMLSKVTKKIPHLKLFCL